MKYIRTKDTEFRNGEILKVLHEGKDYDECEGTFEKRMDCKAYVKKEIVLKVADTIEELCDEFVAINYGINKKPMVINSNSFETVKSMSKECDIYGAIWSEWGLKYVAKMNDKRELELL